MSNTRITITLSEFELRKMKIWAKLHGKTVGTYASQVIGARVEANLDLIERMLSDEANHLNISPEELERRLLEGTNE